MASSSSTDKPAPVSFDDFGRDVLRRRERVGAVDVPPNSGKRRTASKKVLLEAITATGKRWS